MVDYQKIAKFIHTALECSIYLAPTECGLTNDELLEVGRREGLYPGEIGDAMRHAGVTFGSNSRIQPKKDPFLENYFWRLESDFRNIHAFALICSELQDLTRKSGINSAKLDKATLIARAEAKGIPTNDIHAAIVIMSMAGQLNEKNGVLVASPGFGSFDPVKLQADGAKTPGSIISRPDHARIYEIVKDVIARRTDERPNFANALDAFGDELAKLGYKQFKTWWIMTVSELRRTDPNVSPTSMTVLSAAVVEGALTFLVRHVRTLNIGMFASDDFAGSQEKWKIDELIKRASGGFDHAILNQSMRLRAEMLVKARQRIHAGRMLADYQNGPPDLKPEEAREAMSTAELIVRCILDWLQKHPVPH